MSIDIYVYPSIHIYGDKMVSGMEARRKGYKLKLLALINENPDMPDDKIAGILSGLTGLRHAKIREYIEELKVEGKI